MKTKPDNAKANRLLKRDPIIKEVFSISDPDTWLVGGLIRDILLTGGKGRGPRDYDFITRDNPTKLARKLKTSLGGSVVNLRAEQITRLVLKNRHVIDISLLAGNLTDDLNSRDYTINSLAWSRKDGIIDLTGALEDITSKSIALISEENLISDPLRIIRAYRFASCNGLSISSKTRKILRKLAKYITSPARERLTYELSRIVTGPDALPALKAANRDSVLSHLLNMDSDDISYNINRLGRLKGRIGWQPSSWLNEVSGMGMQNRDILRLNALLLGADRARLALPSAMIKRFRLTETGLHRLDKISKNDHNAVYTLLCRAGEAALDMAIISGKRWLLDSYRRLIRMRRQPFITASELIGDYGITVGPEVGRTLKRVELFRFIGQITRRTQLKALLK